MYYLTKNSKSVAGGGRLEGYGKTKFFFGVWAKDDKLWESDPEIHRGSEWKLRVV